jgi:hypothetical protein
MSKKVSAVTAGAVLAGCVVGALLGASPALAAQSTQSITCDGQQLVIRTNSDNSSDMGGWSAAKIVSGGSGTLIPVTFNFAAVDDTTGQQLFSAAQNKGDGNGNHNQATVSCVQTQTGTLADLLEPGDEVPPGAQLTDQVTVTFTAQAVHQP